MQCSALDAIQLAERCVRGTHPHQSAVFHGRTDKAFVNLLDLIMSDMEGNISTSFRQPLEKSDHATVVADFDQLPLQEPPI